MTHIDGRNVKLGIDAPKNVRIDRKEVREQRLTNPEISLQELRDIYLLGVIDKINLHYDLSVKWGSQARKAYALAFTEYQ